MTDIATAPSDRGSLGVLLRLTHQHWMSAVEAALVKAGHQDVRPAHASVFAFTPPEGIHVTELARLAYVRKQTMSHVVEELEQHGYIIRHPDPQDRRARLVFLTPKGEGVRPIAMTAGQQVEANWLQAFGSAETHTLKRSLEGLLSCLQADTTRHAAKAGHRA